MVNLDKVVEAVRLTFEEMAFLDVAAGAGKDAWGPEEEGPVLFLSYSSPRAGSFSLFLPKAIKFLVAEAIYGEEWTALTSAQLDDSLLELMNVLVGRLLTLHFGPDTTYAMGLPTVLYDPPEDHAGWLTQTFPFHVDNNSFLFVWSEVSP